MLNPSTAGGMEVTKSATCAAGAPTGGSNASLYMGWNGNAAAPDRWEGGLSSLKIIGSELTAAQVKAEAVRCLP